MTEDSEAELVDEESVDQTVMDEGRTERTEELDVNAGFVSLADILEENEALLDRAAAEDGDTSRMSFMADDWKLILVNKQHPIPNDYEFTLANISPTQQCDERILPALLTMMQAAQEDGSPLVICSPYRTSDRQENNFANHISRYMRAGMSYMDAYDLTARVVTIPGSSEHEIGLALDFVQTDHYALDEAFEDTDAGRWLAQNSYKYGFILRYPRDKEAITGITYEPWNFRYVGVEAATVMHDEGLCLEEFWTSFLHSGG